MCQTISMYVRWQIIGLLRCGSKQMDIVNQFGNGLSEVSRISFKHRQTYSAKNRPCLGGLKKANAWEGRVLAEMAIQNRTKSSSQLARERGIIFTLDCPNLQSVGYLTQGFAADSLENKLHWLSGTKGNVCNGPNNIARDKWIWHWIRWSDQSQFCFYPVDGRICVWWWRGEDYNQDCVQSWPQTFGGSVMVWGLCPMNTRPHWLQSMATSIVQGIKLIFWTSLSDHISSSSRQNGQSLRMTMPVLIGHTLWMLIKCGTTLIACSDHPWVLT